ncbi:MAG TPA: ATP-binding protein [Solirubrobacteraceae bacterium]|nr:ATP-binding protein [Solirubrobacteraceae bacterium]
MVNRRPPILGLRLNSRPDTAGLVRAALGGLAGPFRLREELVNDLKTAISEACNNAVEHAYRGQSGAIAVHVDIGFESVDVSVRDWGGGFQHLAPAGDRMRVGLPVINALADRAEFLTAPGSGTEVRMSFDIRHDPRRDGLLARVEESEDLEAWTPWRRGLSGDVVVTLLPRELLDGVLEPLISALTARSRFTLERFSDVYLVTRAIAAHVQSAASSGRVSFALGAAEERIDMTIGPLRPGAADELREMGSSERLEASVARLASELDCEAIDCSELLRVVVKDHQRNLSATQNAS